MSTADIVASSAKQQQSANLVM